MTFAPLDFEVSVLDGKFTVKFYKDGNIELLRYGAFWLDGTTTPAGRLILALASELYELRKKAEEHGIL